MESSKPSYAAILSHDKEEGRHKNKTNVYFDNSVRRPRSAPIDDIGQPSTQQTEPRLPKDSDGKQLLNLHHKKLRGQRDALVLDGPRVRPPAVCMVEAPPILQVPRAIKGRPQGEEGGAMAQVTAGRD